MDVQEEAVKSLEEMGFPRNRAVKALIKTNNQGVQLAMDWLFAHNDDADIDIDIDPVEQPPSGAAVPMDEGGAVAPMEGEGAAGGAAASSLKCNECGVLLRSEQAAMMHASKTGHSDFSESTEEIKPLTPEEKAAKVKALQDKMAQKRKEREELEERDARQREIMRRKDGQEMAKQKEEFDRQQKLKELERQRREKEEDKKAKAKIKAQIEQDKRERAARAKGEAPQKAQPPPQPAPAAAAAPAVKYDSARIQVRLSNGEAISNNFQSTDTLAVVYHWVEANRTDGGGAFNLMTNFPKRVYAGADLGMTLAEANLVPSAQLILARA